MHILPKLALLATAAMSNGMAASARAPRIEQPPAPHDAVATLPQISIRARCEGGLVPTSRDVTVFSDGRITVLVAGQIHTGAIAPDEVRKLSARLDAAGFDNVTSPAAPRAPKADARHCALLRVSQCTTHGVRIFRGAPAALASVLRDLLSLTALATRSGAGQ